MDELEGRLFDVLREMQDRRNTKGGHISWIPMLAANHMRASMVTASHANSHGLHAVALGLTRQAFESLMVIDVGLIADDGSSAAMTRWHEGKLKPGELRKWLSEHEWATSGLLGIWDEPWREFIWNLSNALQPYAHFTPELLQWNLNMISPPNLDGHMIAAVGAGHVDQARAVRLQVLRGVLLWTLGRLLAIYEDAQSNGELTAELGTLANSLKESGWLISQSDWADNLIPHLFDLPTVEGTEGP